MHRRSRKAFTLVELLVVISIIGMLMALLLPAVQNARESGRRAVCLNNIRNLGLAIASYETSRRAYPGYRDTLTVNQTLTVAGAQTSKVPVSWLILLLPNLERPDLYRNWKNMTGCTPSASGPTIYTFPTGASGNTLSPMVYMELLVCPSDPQSPQPAGQSQPMSYVVNCGLQDTLATPASANSAGYPGDWGDNGVFVSRWEPPQNPPAPFLQPNADSVSRGDGVSTTLMLSENMEANGYSDCYQNTGSGAGSLTNPVSEQFVGFVWFPVLPLPPAQQQMKINGVPSSSSSSSPSGTIAMNPSPGKANDITYARPSSAHPGGANFVYCDTHTKFVSENIDYLVFTLLMTSNGTGARNVGANAGTPLNQLFTTTPLDEGQVF